MKRAVCSLTLFCAASYTDKVGRPSFFSQSYEFFTTTFCSASATSSQLSVVCSRNS